MKNPTVRFAPSPTGYIHIGNVRTALFNWLYAHKNAGAFILRFDDTDKARSQQRFADAILEDLMWLGLTPDRIEYQSKRFGRYQDITDSLIARELLYPCYETEGELARRRSRQRARGLPPIYDRTALKLSDAEKRALEREGRKPHWRFLLPNYKEDVFAIERTEIHWNDLIRGAQTVDLGSMSDPVLVRADGSWLYTLTSIIDDMDFGVTHIIRGDDHVTNTGVQIAIFKALGHTAPTFGHHNLLIGTDGEGLSKRHGTLSIGSMREEGLEPMAVAIIASLLGTSEPIEPLDNLMTLAAKFDLGKVSKSPARFDLLELRALNAKLLHATPYKNVADRLKEFELHDPKAFWNCVRGNLEVFSDAEQWRQVVIGDIAPLIAPQDRDFISQAANLLRNEPWDEFTWERLTATLKSETDRKGKALFLPLRKAITGLEFGPDMTKLLPLIGRKKTMARLS